MNKKDFQKVKDHNAAIFVLHGAIAILEGLPGGAAVSDERLALWIKEMKEEAQACLDEQERLCKTRRH